MAAKDVIVRRSRPHAHAARRQYPGRRGESHARSQGPQRGAGEILRRPDDHQGRRLRRQGNRAQGQVREHGRADGEGSRFQDLRRRRRRHHHRHRARPGDAARGPEVRCRRHEPDGPQARHRQGRDRGGRGAEEDFQALLRHQGDRPGRHHLRQRRRVHRQDHRRCDGQGRQGRRDHGGRGLRASRTSSTSSRACSSTAAISRRTSSTSRRR